MLTRNPVATVTAPPVPSYRPFRVTVRRMLPLGPHLRRVTLAGPDLGLLASTGLDHRVKLVLPLDGRLCDIGAEDPRSLAQGDWYSRWRALPDAERCPIRTYTIRHARPGRGEVDVDMVLHEPAPGDGPAVRWLRTARPGDEILLVGPDRRAPVSGVDWRPGAATHVLLVGDETAAPAVCAILEQLPRGVRAQAFLEVPTGDDILTTYPSPGSRVSWLARDAGCVTAEGRRSTAPHGLLLQQAVTTWLRRHLAWVGPTEQVEPDDVDVDTTLLWDSPPDPATGDFYAWVAGEAAVVRDLRRLLLRDVGVPRTHAAFLGYWRDGRPEPQ